MIKIYERNILLSIVFFFLNSRDIRGKFVIEKYPREISIKKIIEEYLDDCFLNNSTTGRRFFLINFKIFARDKKVSNAREKDFRLKK